MLCSWRSLQTKEDSPQHAAPNAKYTAVCNATSLNDVNHEQWDPHSLSLDHEVTKMGMLSSGPPSVRPLLAPGPRSGSPPGWTQPPSARGRPQRASVDGTTCTVSPSLLHRQGKQPYWPMCACAAALAVIQQQAKSALSGGASTQSNPYCVRPTLDRTGSCGWSQDDLPLGLALMKVTAPSSASAISHPAPAAAHRHL